MHLIHSARTFKKNARKTANSVASVLGYARKKYRKKRKKLKGGALGLAGGALRLAGQRHLMGSRRLTNLPMAY
jgi:hypothetical protein